MTEGSPRPRAPGFATFTRDEWTKLIRSRPCGPSCDGLDEIYGPLAHLLGVLASARRERARRVAACLGLEESVPPFVIGVTGSVAVGKSRVAEDLRALLGDEPGHGPVDVLSTDAFLYSNQELEGRGLTARKGFPESYDRARLIAALAAVRGGAAEVDVPVYSHREYDVVPGRRQVIARPAVLIVEGLNVLQLGGGEERPGGSTVSDYLDWSIYVDADETDILRWHTERLVEICRSASPDAPGFLGWFSSLSATEARAVAEQSWVGINRVNLREHIAPTRVRASMILHKAGDHRVSHVLVRTD